MHSLWSVTILNVSIESVPSVFLMLRVRSMPYSRLLQTQ